MRIKVLAILLLAVLILVPAGLTWAAGPDDPVSSEQQPDPEQSEEDGEVIAEPAPGDPEPASNEDEKAPDYVRPEEEGEAGITSAEGEDIAEDAELVWALGEEGAPKRHTWIYFGAGAVLLLLAGVFFYSRKKATAK